MAVQIVDLLAVEFVLVGVEILNSNQAIAEFGETIDELAVTTIRQSDGSIGPAKRLRIDKPRIYVDLSPERTKVRQEYPSDDVLPFLHQTISSLFEQSSTPLSTARAHGYNVELTYDQDSSFPAFSYISAKLFNQTAAVEGWSLIGGSGAIRFQSRDGTLRNVTIEPRFRDESSQRVFLSLNLHVDGSNVPALNEIVGRLAQSIDEARAFIEALDGVE